MLLSMVNLITCHCLWPQCLHICTYMCLIMRLDVVGVHFFRHERNTQTLVHGQFSYCQEAHHVAPCDASSTRGPFNSRQSSSKKASYHSSADCRRRRCVRCAVSERSREFCVVNGTSGCRLADAQVVAHRQAAQAATPRHRGTAPPL